MSPSDFAKLHEKIGEFLAERADNDGWCHEDLQSQISHAARLVYDACMEGQKYAREQQP